MPPKPSASAAATASCFPALESQSLRMSYRIARGEQGVLTFEPYKSFLLPHWRFKTPDIARESSKTLWTHFLEYDKAGDFVGMDMARKYIQMGMTRAKRYANYKGGRKYENGVQKDKSEGHEGKDAKQEASDIFKDVWMRCREHKGYNEKKVEFQKEQKEWDKLHKSKVKKENKVDDEDSGDDVKIEDSSNDVKDVDIEEEVKRESKEVKQEPET